MKNNEVYNQLNQILSDQLKDQFKIYQTLNHYYITIGVISDDSARNKSKLKTNVNVGITNAELMFIHENGSRLKHVPKRPVLSLTIKWAEKDLLPQTLDKICDGIFNKNWKEQQIKNELQKMCIRMQNYARRLIYDGKKLKKNAPSTIKSKGSDTPLLDTSQLVRSITCQLKKRK